MPKKNTAIKNTTILAAYLIIVWGFYRELAHFPEEIEEMIIKPILWLGPVIYLIKKEKAPLSSIGVTGKNLFNSIYLSLILGMFFAFEGLFINIIKYKGINFSANLGENSFYFSLLITLFTAVSEELTFRGYFFTRIWSVVKNEWSANLITTAVWAIIHVPIAIFWWGSSILGVVGYLILVSLFGIGSAFIFARTKNVTSSILLHLMWEWPIILFR
jgi:membrane protease YdiL (CAAX protease family)